MFQQSITDWHFYLWTILLTRDCENNSLLQDAGINMFILEENNANVYICSN